MNHLIELMKKHPNKDIYELINNDIDDKFEKHTLNSIKYTSEERKSNFDKLKPILEENAL
jgi:hypothetical protein